MARTYNELARQMRKGEDILKKDEEFEKVTFENKEYSIPVFNPMEADTLVQCVKELSQEEKEKLLWELNSKKE